MTSEEQNTPLPPVLTASVHDIRYLVALLRGVNFANRANMTITESGLTITVEEARTLLGVAFIFKEVFDEYVYHPPQRSRSTFKQKQKAKQKSKQKSKQKKSTDSDSATEPDSESEFERDQDETMASEGDEEEDLDQEFENAALEVPLNTVIECLNIFGSAGSLGSSEPSTKGKKWKKGDDDSDREGGGGEDMNARGYIGIGGGSERRTGMRLTYSGPGAGLKLIIAEDASGPTTTCEIDTYDPEPQLELDFKDSETLLRIILKSSWFRDALSELDPSCEKLTIIGNPPGEGGRAQSRTSKPILRLRAAGTFGTTEMDYPNDREVLETFECQTSVAFSYRFGHISRTLRALQNSTKTSVRIDKDGLLSLQFLLPSSKPRGMRGSKAGEQRPGDAFIEFRCLPLEEA